VDPGLGTPGSSLQNCVRGMPASVPLSNTDRVTAWRLVFLEDCEVVGETECNNIVSLAVVLSTDIKVSNRGFV